jgi:transposase-like protein
MTNKQKDLTKAPASHTGEAHTNEASARAYLEGIRWPHGPICPHCGGMDRQSRIEENAAKKIRAGLLYCGHCRLQYTVTVGTVFADSKVPLHKWVHATHLLCTSKKGFSAKQLERVIGVTYKTAWFMAHRIREAMKSEGGMLGGNGPTEDSIVEADETYITGKPGRKMKRRARKDAIFALVERKGQVRAMHVPDVTARTLKSEIRKHVQRQANMMTDEAGQYRGLYPEFRSHDTVNHSRKEYVRDDTHTNTIEGFFSIMKRGIYGVYQHVSSHHLQRYVGEYEFRYNNRSALGVEDAARTAAALRGIWGKRLTYKRVDAQAS